MAAQPSPSALVSRQLGVRFAHAAPDLMTWSQERQFFQIQVANLNHSSASIQSAIANNVERTIESIRDAALACAAMGLSMNPIAALVYFIPRREREFNEELDKSEAEYKAKVPWVITATPSYRGLAWIATHHAGADDVAAEVVFAADVFKPRGPFHLPRHEPTIDNAKRRYEDAIGVYCGIRWPGGRERSEYIDRPTVLYIRSLSKMAHGLMWSEKKLWSEGWKKAVVRRACKLGIQGNPRMDAAEAAMREVDGELIDVPAPGDVPRGTPEPEAPKNGAKPRGMGGLRTGLETAAVKQATANEAAAAAEAAIVTAGAGAASEPKTETTQPADWFAPSKQPKGSIEWWGDQLAVVTTRQGLHVVRDQAKIAKVDEGVDANAFAELYRKTSMRLRETETKTGGKT